MKDTVSAGEKHARKTSGDGVSQPHLHLKLFMLNEILIEPLLL